MSMESIGSTATCCPCSSRLGCAGRLRVSHVQQVLADAGLGDAMQPAPRLHLMAAARVTLVFRERRTLLMDRPIFERSPRNSLARSSNDVWKPYAKLDC